MHLPESRRTSTAPSVACSSLRLNEAWLESSSSAAHTLCTDGTAYCAAAAAVTAMGSPSLVLFMNGEGSELFSRFLCVPVLAPVRASPGRL